MKALVSSSDYGEEIWAKLDPPSSRAAIRERAQQALQHGDYPLVESLLNQGEVSIAELTENLLIYQAELEIQNEELRRAQVDEQRAIARFTTLFARIPQAVLVVDRTGLILQANEAADHLFGLQAHHLSQRFLHRLLESPRNALGQVLVDVRTIGVSLARSVAFRTAGGGRFVGDLHMARLPTMERSSPSARAWGWMCWRKAWKPWSRRHFSYGRVATKRRAISTIRRCPPRNSSVNGEPARKSPDQHRESACRTLNFYCCIAAQACPRLNPPSFGGAC